ncbi:hypothetical protein ABWS22_000777 [Salmonella enterica subsp. enterica serovar Braenderup]
MDIDEDLFVANRYMAGDFAKFSNWNESMYLELMDEINQNHLSSLTSSCLEFESPKKYFMHLLKLHDEKIIKFIESYNGYGSCPNTPPYIIYAAIILTQYSRLLYKHIFYDLHNITEFTQNSDAKSGNIRLIKKSFNFVQDAARMNYWPFLERQHPAPL